MDFSNYQDRDRDRRNLLLGAAAGIGAAFAIPVVRRGAAKVLLGGVAAVGRKFGRGVGPLKIESSAKELRSLLEHVLPRAAQASLATERAAVQLEKALAQSSTAQLAAIHGRELASSTAFRNFLLSGSKRELKGILKDREVADILGRHIASVQKLNPAEALEMLRKKEQARVVDTLTTLRSTLPTQAEAANHPIVKRARQQVHEIVSRQVAARSQKGLAARVMDAFGVEAVTLGDPELLGQLGGSLDETLSTLRAAANAGDVDRLAAGGFYRVGGQVMDFRGATALKDRMLGWVKDNLQIPLSPGSMGIVPGQLLPWRNSRLPREYAHISSRARDPILRALMGSTTDRVGQDVFKIGDEWLSVNFAAENADEAVQALDLKAHLHSGLYGFARNRAASVNAAQAARGRPLESPLDWFINRDWRNTELGENLSVFTKFWDQRWGPNLFKRIVGGNIDELVEDDITRAANFLTSRGLPQEVREALSSVVGPAFEDKSLRAFASNLEDDQSVINFFNRAAGGSDEVGRFASPQLKRLVQQYQSSPISVLSQVKPSPDREFISAGLLGIEADRTGLDMMRQAIADEMLHVVAGDAPENWTNWVKSLSLTHADDTAQALAYGHGRQLQSLLRQEEGVGKAASWLRGDLGAQENVERFVKKYSNAWGPFRIPDTESLNTAEIMVPKGPNLAFELVRNLNEAYKSGNSLWDATVNTVKGPAGRQYAALFTGNQADVTSTTLMYEWVPRKLEQYMQGVGLGLPQQDMTSAASIMGNLMLKRVLLAATAYELYRYWDYRADEGGYAGPSDLYANIRSRAGLWRAKHTGENLFGLGDRDLFPGLEKLIPDRTVEEELEHQKSGREPIRKGRFWSIGSRTPWYGEKIDYYLPSAVQAARSGWQGAPNADLNTRDYWAHSWIPLPENKFLGPLNWLNKPYWWEEKHREDRPYLISGEMFDPNTPHGPILNETVGRVLKPTRVMHPEYLPTDLGGSASREQLRAINQAQKQGLDMRGAGVLVGGAGNTGGGGGAGFGGGVGTPGVIGRGGGGAAVGSIGQITPGGQVVPLALPPDLSGEEFGSLGRSSRQRDEHGQRLSHREIERLNRMTKAGVSAMAKISPSSVTRMASQMKPFSDDDLDLVNYQSGVIQGLSNATDVAGLYGFMTREALRHAGIPLEQPGTSIESPTRGYGFARRFYDASLGGLGEGLSEVGRRFLSRPDQRDFYNPVPNRMPGWLPGPEYFLDFRHGDPYTKIPKGEMRLPGEAFERLHPEVKLMQTRASSIGKSMGDIMQGMLSIDEPLSDYGEMATEVGNVLHEKLQRKWKRMGVLVGAEDRIYNEELGISGHYDAILRTAGGLRLIDIKTVSDKRFQQARRSPFSEHVSQVNYYLSQTPIKQGGLIYINRDKPWEVTTHEFGFDKGRFDRDIAKVQEARRTLLSLVNKGVLTRGDLYDPVTRFEILSDVAPYSENYSQLREYLVEKHKAGDLTEADNARFQQAKKRVAAQKKRIDVTPYRFSNVRVDYARVKVAKILDPNTILIEGSDNPLRLAGGRSSQARIEEAYGPAPEGMSLAEWQFAQFGIRPGSRIRVALEEDPMRQVADDVLKTRHAVIFGRGGNINQQLIEQGVATEKETDWSSTGVLARFTPQEIAKGRAWERIAHADTPLNNKFLRVRSPLEELERGIVFGKNTGGWSSAFRDYISPSLSSFIARNNPILAGGGLGLFASFFLRTKQAKKWAVVGGVVAGAAASLIRQGYEQSTGKVWKPARTTRREALEEYWDVLKYMKYRGLAEREEQLAKRVEGIDIDRMTRELFEEGQARARRKNWLEGEKRKLVLEDRTKNRDKIAELQNQLEKLAEPQGLMKLGPHATRALQYREMYRSTLYGFEPGNTPFLNLFRAFPKYKRELITGFIEKSSEKERKRIFQLLPKMEQRAIGKYLGMDEGEIPDRPTLREFFRDHPLPDRNWKGWQPDVDLEGMRQIAIKREGLDPLESAIYPQQIEEAERQMGNIPIPTMRGKGTDIQQRVNEILSGRGLTNVRVQVDVTPHDGEEDDLQVQLNIRQRRERDIMNALQMRG